MWYKKRRPDLAGMAFTYTPYSIKRVSESKGIGWLLPCLGVVFRRWAEEVSQQFETDRGDTRMGRQMTVASRIARHLSFDDVE
jgi:hypothetical protein